jgi:hypothetical protein
MERVNDVTSERTGVVTRPGRPRFSALLTIDVVLVLTLVAWVLLPELT